MVESGIALPRRLSGLFRQWALRRRPQGRTVTLNQKRIFIFPGRAGWAFLLVCSLLLLIGINYENNLVHAVAFLLLSVFVLSILHTYSNLSGITVEAVRAYPCFAGEQATFELRLSAEGRRPRENIQAAWADCPPQTVKAVSTRPTILRLFHPTTRRGLLRPEALLLETYYPLGLLRAWSWVQLDVEAVVYPTPASTAPAPLPASLGRGEGEPRGMNGGDDFFALEPYQPGMSLKHIAWKVYARGQGLHTKSYAATLDQRVWLDWDAFGGMPTEERLSLLCYWVLALERKGAPYGLRLPAVEIEPAQGEKHRNRLLTELALFGGGGR